MEGGRSSGYGFVHLSPYAYFGGLRSKFSLLFARVRVYFCGFWLRFPLFAPARYFIILLFSTLWEKNIKKLIFLGFGGGLEVMRSNYASGVYCKNTPGSFPPDV
jgi:hypothetical protein